MNSVAYRVPPTEVAGSATDLREAASGSTSPPYLCKVKDGFSVRQGHLAPPVATPDSPRPQKTAEALPTGTLTVPTATATTTAAANASDATQSNSAESANK